MLILTRKLDESIIIGNDIEVKVVSLTGSQVHIGVSAPREVPIYRSEVYEQVKAGNRAAVSPRDRPDGNRQAGLLADLVRKANPAGGKAAAPRSAGTSERKEFPSDGGTCR